ncbi:LLM class flavin-dependent oxidoreductase [Nocardioides terrisoli]|uniref:LLM class flavin-dependent oxidoreductase n=1 Tax=Nocardioides terrisoli TaxID=3388267 RepID=UPI00287B9D45|nr:LLM class flavin-dependent oxidoreductase [Nocardioides marmorisolisilvae]
MRFIYFHFMPFDALPADFSEKYRSSWVDLPASLGDSRRVHGLYNTYLNQLELADASGFHGLGLNEHHNNAYGLVSNPGLMTAALARRTSKSALLVMGNSIPLYNPAIRIAEETALLDVLTGGRIIAGFPMGTSQDTNFVYGVEPRTTRARYNEGFELIKRAWTEPDVFSFNGEFNKLRYVNPWPRPLQKPHPPIWAPGSGSVETFDFAVKHDIPYTFLSFFGSDFAEANMKKYWARVDAMGRDRNPYRAGMVQTILVADTDEEARRLYEPHVKYFYQRLSHVYPGYAEAPGYKSLDSLRAAVPPKDAPGGARRDTFAAARDLTWDEFVDSGIVIAGSPSTVRDRLSDAADRLNIGNWISLLHLGDMPDELARQNIDLFTSKVLPGLENKFSGYEHRWWPKPLDLSERGVPDAARTGSMGGAA